MNKRCPKCATVKALADFARRREAKDGLQVWCRACCAAGRAAWAAADPARAREKAAKWAKENPEANRARASAWRSENAERAKARDAGYRRANLERLTAAGARWRAENRDEILDRRRAARAANAPAERERDRQWKRANHGKVIAAATARKRRVRRAAPPWLTREQRRHIAAFYETAALLSRHAGQPYNVDHIVPLIHDRVCGLHVPWNLQILTAAANVKKSNRFDEINACVS